MTDPIATMSAYNEWRRGDDSPQPDPKPIGIAIDAVIAELESLRKNEYICKKCGLRKNDKHPKGDF